MKSVDDGEEPEVPSPSPSTTGTPHSVQIIMGSDSDSDKTNDLETEKEPSYSAPVYPPRSGHTLRKWTHNKSHRSKDGTPLKEGSEKGEGG